MTDPAELESRRRWLFAALGAGIGAALGAPAVAQDRAARNREIYVYRGADREQRLLDGAKKEGAVAIFTSLNTKDSIPLSDAFEKRYGLKTQLWRSSSERVLQRAISEARAGRHGCDIVETNGPELEALYREKLLEPFWSPAFADLPPEAFPKHGHYVATRFNFFTVGYNTNLVKPDEVPSTYEDLLHPRWVGRIGLEGSDVDWFAATLKSMGEQKGLAYFRKLADMKPQIRTGHTLLAELVAAGEIPLAATIYNHSAERLMQRGAPIRWKPLAPTFARPNAIGTLRHAPNPHAALLFADFMLSRDGQLILKERNRVPASRKVDSPLNDFPFEMIDPVIVLDEAPKWEKLWSALFLKGASVSKEPE